MEFLSTQKWNLEIWYYIIRLLYIYIYSYIYIDYKNTITVYTATTVHPFYDDACFVFNVYIYYQCICMCVSFTLC